jgi:hypothetical protein
MKTYFRISNAGRGYCFENGKIPIIGIEGFRLGVRD